MVVQHNVPGASKKTFEESPQKCFPKRFKVEDFPQKTLRKNLKINIKSKTEHKPFCSPYLHLNASQLTSKFASLGPQGSFSCFRLIDGSQRQLQPIPSCFGEQLKFAPFVFIFFRRGRLVRYTLNKKQK